MKEEAKVLDAYVLQILSDLMSKESYSVFGGEDTKSDRFKILVHDAFEIASLAIDARKAALGPSFDVEKAKKRDDPQDRVMRIFNQVQEHLENGPLPKTVLVQRCTGRRENLIGAINEWVKTGVLEAEKVGQRTFLSLPEREIDRIIEEEREGYESY